MLKTTSKLKILSVSLKKKKKKKNGKFIALCKLVEVLSSSHMLVWLGLPMSVDDL